ERPGSKAAESGKGEPSARAGLVVGLTFVAALVFALVVRGGQLLVGVTLLFIVFVPLERLFALRKQKVIRKGLLTDLTHILVNNTFVTIGAIALVIVAGIPFYAVRALDLQDQLPPAIAVTLAVVLVVVGNYWGHRFTHQIPQLWRFHAVHHSIEQMDF